MPGIVSPADLSIELPLWIVLFFTAVRVIGFRMLP
jgi:hypothetical protein